MESNPFDVNPYSAIAQTLKQVNDLKKQYESILAQFHSECMPIFRKDQDHFEKLKLLSKDLHLKKAPQSDIDAVYLQMAMIYKKWLPIEDELHAMNPEYIKLFAALKLLLNDIEKKENHAKKEKSQIKTGSETRIDSDVSKRKRNRKRTGSAV